MDYDVVVIGAGHAGCEAARAASLMGAKTALITLRLDAVAQMSCNPAVGGIAKGHVVKEIDALGGVMGYAADCAGIQFRVLNKSRGIAVRAPRVQCDRALYSSIMRETLQALDNLRIVEGEATDIVPEKDAFKIYLSDKNFISSKTVILTTGTFLGGLIHIGEKKIKAGRYEESSSELLADSLSRLGFELLRLKTGTPPRLIRETIDWDAFSVQPPDDVPEPFSWRTREIKNPQLSCYLGYTNEDAHRVLLKNLKRSPLYGGEISGVGPRYCPSIEDKVVKFPQRTRHQIFFEPEGLQTNWIYPNGVSTSMPADTQDEFLRKIEGLENVKIARYGYAVEYFAIQPTQLYPALESKLIGGLFFAGQINGTSGYEEAAGQGLIAGINAVLKIRGEEPFTLRRDEAYIGVMIDDLVTQGINEPYRLFTSRAEFRLLLDANSADERLTRYGAKFGLIDKEREDAVLKKYERIASAVKVLAETALSPNKDAEKHLGITMQSAQMLEEILRRPEVGIDRLKNFVPDGAFGALSEKETEMVEARVKYAGYIAREREAVGRLKRQAGLKIPSDFSFRDMPGLSREAVEKLQKIRPADLAQAGRITGITPAALSIIAMHIKKREIKDANNGS